MKEIKSESFRVFGTYYFEKNFEKMKKLDHVKVKIIPKPNDYDKTALMILHGKTGIGFVGEDNKNRINQIYQNASACYVDIVFNKANNKHDVTLTIEQ